MRPRALLTVALATGALGCTWARELLRGYSFHPERRDATDERVRDLRVPAGYSASVFARGITGARMLAVADDGALYVTQPSLGRVTRLVDRDGDGAADELKIAIEGLPKVHGIALREGRVFLAAPTTLWQASVKTDGRFGPARVVVGDLPRGGRHENRMLGFGPDGLLYISIGSSCNACRESSPEHATIVRMREDGSERRVFARGLRNTIGFAWHPTTHELWGMDNGVDYRGDDEPPEELNRITDGGDYGWPYVFGERRPDPFMRPPGMSLADYAARTIPSVLEYQPHAAPIAFVFADAESAFVAMRGSWNRSAAVGYKVVRIRYSGGQPVRFEDFLTGFLVENGDAQFARPAGLAVARDATLFVGDDENGVIYRVRRH
jgi:glucose/arabinose dehydrogenase